MNILAIETSCDETAVAVVEDGVKIISNVVASSAELQAKFGGVIPERAAREQIKSMIPVLEEVLDNAKIQKNEIDAIAVTVGPGLIGSLLVGVETARTLSYLFGKPLIAVNHLVGHIYANFVSEIQNSKIKSQNYKLPEFPALALVVSGGHTELVLMRGHGDLEWIGGTRDDAAGEAFDKSARLIGLPYPGGPAIAAEAAKFEASSTKSQTNSKLQISNSRLNLFPRPIVNEENYDWSFSGLKTAVLRLVQSAEYKVHSKSELAANIQEAIVDCLVIKSARAIEEFKPKSFLLAGGVAANQRLAEKFKLQIPNSKHKVEIFVPDPKLCTDNAACIGSAAFFNQKIINWREISANPELLITSRV